MSDSKAVHRITGRTGTSRHSACSGALRQRGLKLGQACARAVCRVSQPIAAPNSPATATMAYLKCTTTAGLVFAAPRASPPVRQCAPPNYMSLPRKLVSAFRIPKKIMLMDLSSCSLSLSSVLDIYYLRHVSFHLVIQHQPATMRLLVDPSITQNMKSLLEPETIKTFRDFDHQVGSG
jgi:hypothetical protein